MVDAETNTADDAGCPRDRTLELVEKGGGQRGRLRDDVFDARDARAGGLSDLRKGVEQRFDALGPALGFRDQRGQFDQRPVRGLDQPLRLVHEPHDHDGRSDEGDCYNHHADLGDERHRGHSFPSDTVATARRGVGIRPDRMGVDATCRPWRGAGARARTSREGQRAGMRSARGRSRAGEGGWVRRGGIRGSGPTPEQVAGVESDPETQVQRREPEPFGKRPLHRVGIAAGRTGTGSASTTSGCAAHRCRRSPARRGARASRPAATAPARAHARCRTAPARCRSCRSRRSTAPRWRPASRAGTRSATIPTGETDR